ncbi:MAG: hypothetical protein QNJ15_13305 [Erythrobacter sp.]|nr:hypothetical protein [Erythrobacter sp.]
MQPLPVFISAQRQAMVANWKKWDVSPMVAFKNLGIFDPSLSGSEVRATSWQPLGKTSAVIQRTHGGVLSLWVDPAADNYVDQFRKFLTEHAKVDDSDLTKQHDVDHLFNRERAIKLGYKFVRLFPVPYRVNRSHGAGYEKAMTAAASAKNPKQMKLMDEVSIMKFFGFKSPRKSGKLSKDQDQHLRNMAKTHGLPEELIFGGVENLMDRAHQRK